QLPVRDVADDSGMSQRREHLRFAREAIDVARRAEELHRDVVTRESIVRAEDRAHPAPTREVVDHEAVRDHRAGMEPADHRSGIPPTRDATTGRPEASASRITFGHPSRRLGKTKTSAAAIHFGISS